MQRRIAVIGKIEDVRSFLQTYKSELKLAKNAEEVVNAHYQMTFFSLGFVAYGGKEFQYEHLSLNNLNNFQARINHKKVDAAIMINSTDKEFRIVDDVKISRDAMHMARIPFLAVNHTVGGGGNLEVKNSVVDLLSSLKYGTRYQGELPTGIKIKQGASLEAANFEPEEENNGEEGLQMTVFSKR